MSTLADRTIDALRHEHDTLTSLVDGLTPDQLVGPSGAAEWTLAQVLSHLGSGAEISLAGLQAALGEREAPGEDFNPSVWARWDSSTPEQQAAGFVEHNGALVAAFEALDPEQRASLQIPISFLPVPLTVAGAAGLRLNEVAHHSWDARVGVDPSAGLTDVSTAAVVDHMSGDLGFLLGFIGKADQVDEPVVLALGDSGYAIAIDEGVSVTRVSTGSTSATFTGPLEAALRLTTGRLSPEHTPADVAVTGNVTLETLRKVFPGF